MQELTIHLHQLVNKILPKELIQVFLIALFLRLTNGYSRVDGA